MPAPVLLKAGQLLSAGLDAAQIAPFLVGMVMAFAVGYGAIALLLAYVRERPLHIFVVYRLGLAALIAAGWYLGRPWPPGLNGLRGLPPYGPPAAAGGRRCGPLRCGG